MYSEDEIEAMEDEPMTCDTCRGSGEGMVDGSRCRDCRGTGEVIDREREREEAFERYDHERDEDEA